MAERFPHLCAKKSSFLACTLVTLILPHLATSARQAPPINAVTSPDIISGPPLADLPNFPIGYDVIQGNPPDAHIQHWIRYVIAGQQNHPFPIVFFSPQEFKPKTALESLIVLSDSEYKRLSVFSRRQHCTKQEPGPKIDQWPAGDITEHDAKKTTRCALSSIDACNYLLRVAELSGIKWTPAQLKLIQRMATETNCKTEHSTSSP